MIFLSLPIRFVSGRIGGAPRRGRPRGGSNGIRITTDRFPHRCDTLLVSLANGPQEAGFGLQVGQAHGAQLGDPQSGGIEQLEHGPVTQAGGLGRIGSC